MSSRPQSVTHRSATYHPSGDVDTFDDDHDFSVCDPSAGNGDIVAGKPAT
jgi:hypothetical protein